MAKFWQAINNFEIKLAKSDRWEPQICRIKDCPKFAEVSENKKVDEWPMHLKGKNRKMRPKACELSIGRWLMKMVRITEAPNVDWINE